MTAYHPRPDFGLKTANGGSQQAPVKPNGQAQVNIDLQESLAHLHPLQRQHAIQLHQQQQQHQQLEVWVIVFLHVGNELGV